MGKKQAVPTIQQTGLRHGQKDDVAHLEDLRRAIQLTSRFIASIDRHKPTKPVSEIAMTGPLRRLETAVSKDDIHLLAIPKAYVKSYIKPQFEMEPDIPLEANRLIEFLENKRGARSRDTLIQDIVYTTDPSTATITLKDIYAKDTAIITITMVPGKNHWGINRIITSGDEEFSTWVRSKKPNGLLLEHMEIIGQKLVDCSGKKPKQIRAQTESKVFELCEVSYIPVSFRISQLWLTYLETKQSIRPREEVKGNLEDQLYDLRDTI